MQFSDLEPGRIIVTESRRVTEREIIAFAQAYDPQWFHTDPARAEAGRWRGLIASGWLTCSIAMELVVRCVLQGSESFGSPGVEQLRWLNPLRPGDEVSCRVEILEVSRSPSGNSGRVRWHWQLSNQRSEQVLGMITTSLFDLRLNR